MTNFGATVRVVRFEPVGAKETTAAEEVEAVDVAVPVDEGDAAAAVPHVPVRA